MKENNTILKSPLKYVIQLLIVLLLLVLVREVIFHGIRSNKVGEYDKLNTLFVENNHFNTLFIGSSRAESHYNSEVFDSITGLTSFNIGLEGASAPMIRGALEAYLEHSEPPEHVVMNIDFHNFVSDTIRRYPRFFPYLSLNKAFYNTLKSLDPNFVWYKWNPIYGLAHINDNYLYAAYRGFSGYTTAFDESFTKGFTPLPLTDGEPVEKKTYEEINAAPPEEVYKAIKDIMEICKLNNINLSFVVSPTYIKMTESVLDRNTYFDKINSLAKENGFTFKTYLDNDICNNEKLFCDPNHLNYLGS
ncbi:MAG: hypothetical protein IH948_09090, partial [Bacteroidetes bacterium]|nr:hypothetical protein [Bacteroidota bacterium]